MKSRWYKWPAYIIFILCAVYSVLLIPGPEPPAPAESGKKPFAWNLDTYWSILENAFKQATAAGCESITPRIADHFDHIDNLMTNLESDTLSPGEPLLAEIENSFFELSVFEAACPDRLNDYIDTFSRLRRLVKKQSINWDINSRPARDRIYRLLYGGRTAVEEVMMQAPLDTLPSTIIGVDEPSATPEAEILGVKIHSGDILVSRGGAPTSALIARGNDYPGNFSHAALVHIDSIDHKISIIESHIEMGVAVADLDDYLRDTKLRVMVLRLRADLPCMIDDPMLPHRAAEYALRRAHEEHIPYDFAMDTDDPSKLFCSEVVSDAYRRVGVRLWSALSHISSPGVKDWLAAFGVRHFTTQEPSDLEYDPQLRVVAEWRDHETLYKDRLDNAVVDIMLEKADRGVRLEYDRYMLPAARIMKVYSVFLNQFGGVGPVPKGMDAVAALKNEWFSNRHSEIKEKLIALAERFEHDKGYSPPYWELIKLARQAYETLY